MILYQLMEVMAKPSDLIEFNKRKNARNKYE